MKNILKFILIILLIALILFIINFTRNYLIINNLFSAENKLGNITDYYYKNEDNYNKQTQEVYSNKNFFFETTTFENKTFKLLFDKNNNTLTTLSENNDINTETNTSYIVTTPYKNVFFIGDTDKNKLIKEYLFKPIQTEDNFYILKYNDSEAIWYINKNTYQIEKYILERKHLLLYC